MRGLVDFMMVFGAYMLFGMFITAINIGILALAVFVVVKVLQAMGVA